MRAVKGIVRKYYKYQYVTFVQPSPTSNGTMGQGDFACDQSWYSTWQGTYPAYKAFSGSQWSTIWEDNPTGSPPQWISWYTKNPIKLTSFTFQQGNEPYYYYITAAIVQGSNDNSTWVDIGTIGNCYNQSTVTVTINSDTAYNYHRIYVTGANWFGAYYGFRMINILLSAQERIAVESTAQDYDFYKDINEYKVPRETIRHYYKYQYSSWVQPVLTSNGIIGGSSFACSASSYYDSQRQPFNAFDGLNDSSEAHCWHANYGYPQWLSWYNPVELKITNLKVYNRPVSANAIVDYQIQISSNNSVWTTIKTGTNTVITVGSSWNIDLSDIENNTSKYWRIYITSGSDANYVVIGEMQLTAQQRTVVAGTSSDYDFYIDNNTYYGVNQ